MPATAIGSVWRWNSATPTRVSANSTKSIGTPAIAGGSTGAAPATAGSSNKADIASQRAAELETRGIDFLLNFRLPLRQFARAGESARIRAGRQKQHALPKSAARRVF